MPIFLSDLEKMQQESAGKDTTQSQLGPKRDTVFLSELESIDETVTPKKRMEKFRLPASTKETKSPSAVEAPVATSGEYHSNQILDENNNPFFLGGGGMGGMFVGGPVVGPGLGQVKMERKSKDYNYLKWAMEPEDPSNGLIANLPNSAAKLPGRLVTSMIYEYPKTMVDEYKKYKATVSTQQYKDLPESEKRKIRGNYASDQIINVAKPIEDIMVGYIKSTGLYDIVKDTANKKVIYLEDEPDGNGGFKKKVAFALPEMEEFKQMWKSDPAGTALLYLPFMFHAMAKKKAKEAKTAEETKLYNTIAEESTQRARDARAAESNATKVKADSLHRQAQVVEQEGFLGENYIEETFNNLMGIQDAFKQDIPKPIKASTKRVTTKVKKAAEAKGIKGVKTEQDLVTKAKEELSAATTAEEAALVEEKYSDLITEGTADLKSYGQKATEGDQQILSDQKMTEASQPELNASTVEDLDSPGWSVMYDGIDETVGGKHRITIVPEGMTSAEVIKSGKASTIYASDFADAKTKVAQKIADYTKVDDIKNNTLDNVVGIKKRRKEKPIENPEQSPWFMDKERTDFNAEGLRKMDPEVLAEDVDVYLAALVNEVNKWYHGADVDIAAARKKLSKLAEKVDDLKEDFNKPLESEIEVPEGGDFSAPYDAVSRFDDYKASVQDAAQWARRLQRPDRVSTTTQKSITPSDVKYGTVRDIQFYSGLPLDKIAALLGRIKEYAFPIIKNSEHVESVKMVDSSAKGVKGKDVDLLYEMKIDTLAKDSAKAAEQVQEVIERTKGIDLNSYDTFVKVGDRYFQVKDAEVIESLDYRKLQKGKEIVDVVSRGTKLRTGVDPTESKLFDETMKYFTAVKTEKENLLAAKKAGRFTKVRRELNRALLSRSANLRRDAMMIHPESGGYDVFQQLNLVTSATSHSAGIAKQLKTEILSGLSAAQKEALNFVNFAARCRQVMDGDALMKAKNKKYKSHAPVGGLSREHWQVFIDNIERLGLTPEEVTEVYRRSDALFDIARDQLRQGKEKGIYSEADYENLKNLDYSRRQMLDIIDPEVTLGGKRIGVRESGLQELKIGSKTELLEIDAIKLMEDLVIRTQNRIMMNDAWKAMYDLAEKNPDSPIARIKGPEKWQVGDETIDLKGDSLRGWDKVEGFVNGERKAFYMPPEYAKEWVNKNKEMSYQLSQNLRLISGSSALRAMATGVNVGFAVKNIFRDFAYMWVASQHYVPNQGWTSTYSTVMPKAIGQMAIDLKEVSRDVFLRKGIYEDYVAHGGPLDFLSDKNEFFRERYDKSYGKHVEAIRNALYYPANTSELLGRVSLYNRAIKKLKALDPKRDIESIKKEAAFISRDYMNFGDYGYLVKAIDTVVPYFGATIKATEGIFRSAISRNTMEFSAKALQAALFGATTYLINNAVNKEAYSQVSEHDRKNNTIVPIYIPYKGTDGSTHWLYPKIPRDQGQMFFMALGEYGMRSMLGDEKDPKIIADALKGLSPVGKIPLPPAAEAGISYFTNTDMWTWDDIWPGPKVGTGSFDLEAEVVSAGPNKTNPVSVAAGKATGMSPERLSRSVQSFTSRNYMTDAFTTLTSSIFDQVPADIRDGNVGEFLATNSTFRGMLGSTDEMNPVRRAMEQVEVDRNKMTTMNNGQLDRLLEQVYVDKNKPVEAIDKFIDDIAEKDPIEADRLEKRAEYGEQVNGLPHAKLWKRMDSANPEVAAGLLHEFMKNRTQEDQDKILDEFEEYNDISNVASERFLDEFDRLEDGE